MTNSTKITDECFSRVSDILEDIDSCCETEDYYEEWEDVARASFSAFLDELDAERFDMTCAAVRESIIESFDEGRENYAKGIRMAFYGYLCERRDYLDFSEEYDKPELPEDADENDREQYDEAMALYYRNKEYNDCLENRITDIARLTLE